MAARSPAAHDKATPPKQIIFLAGAPDAAHIDWTDRTLELLERFDERVTRYLTSSAQPFRSPPSSDVPHAAKWRVLPLDNGRTGMLSFEDDDERSAFLEHTLTALESTLPPQDADEAPGGEKLVAAGSFCSITSTDVSFSSSSSNSSSDPSSTEVPQAQEIHFRGSIQDLKSIPSARYLLAIAPQTMTFDLLVGVISIESRTVRLRTRDVEMQLMEVLVGDDTATAFKITFWLPPSSPHATTARAAEQTHDQTLTSLRTGDVVLITHVALHVYRSVVYGQSLHRKFAKNTTRVTVLGPDVVGLGEASREKLARVRRWTREFVGVRSGAFDTGAGLQDRQGLKRRRAGEEELPDDTPAEL